MSISRIKSGLKLFKSLPVRYMKESSNLASIQVRNLTSRDYFEYQGPKDRQWKIRYPRDDEFKLYFKNLAKEGWEGSHDFYKTLYDQNRETFIAAVNEKDEIIAQVFGHPVGELIATKSALRAEPEYRGLGLSKPMLKLLKANLLKLRSNIIIHPENSPFVHPIYVTGLGFHLSPYMIAIFIGKPLPTPKIKADFSELDGIEVKDYREVDWEDIVKFDSSITLVPRSEFMKLFLFDNSRKGYVAIKGKNIVGIGAMSVGKSVAHISPLYANDMNIARKLMLALFETDTGDRPIEFPYPMFHEDPHFLCHEFMKQQEPLIYMQRAHYYYDLPVGRNAFAISNCGDNHI